MGGQNAATCFFLTEIKRCFPDAKFVHLIRDGRDVAESLKRVLIGPKSIYRIAKRWVGYIKAFEDFKKEVNDKDYIEIFW